jgi:predicted nucleotidyltransferase
LNAFLFARIPLPIKANGERSFLVGDPSVTVSDRILRLLDSIQPGTAELDKYESHHSTVAARLSKVFPGTKVEIIGSHSRGSAISGSDLDLLALLPSAYTVWGEQLKNSNTVLKNITEELSLRYGNTGIGKDGVAVVADFGGRQYSVDIVPAIFDGMMPIGPNGTQRPVRLIPDGQGDWLQTAPKAHAEYIAAANMRSGGKLKGVAQLLKFWTTTRNTRIPISSFHIEMVLAASGVCAGVKSYSACLAEAFQVFKSRKLAALQDPLGISGQIQAARTQAKREQALASVYASADKAAKAYVNETLQSLSDAYELWDQVFNGDFPRR